MYCKKCGQKMEENTKVCSNCGYDMGLERDSQSNSKSDSVIGAKKSKSGSVVIISVAAALVLLIGIFLYMVSFGGYDRIRVSRLCDLGDRYLSEMDFEQAVASYQAAIELDPKAEDAYLGLADAYIGQGNYEAAIEALERGIAESSSEMLTEYLAEINAEYSQIEAARLAEEAAAAEEAARIAEEEAAAAEEAAKQEEANMYYEAGRACLYGLDGQEINYAEANTNFEKALELGKTEANFYLGALCDWYGYPEKDYEKAREYYEADSDNPYAQLSLGFLYCNGQGVEEDTEKAQEIFDAVIASGCVEGYLGSAAIARDNEDYDTAIECYNKVLEGEEQLYIANAMDDIGDLYYIGQGVEQDYAQAMEWYEKAAELGDASAMYSIGYMYDLRKGVEQDYAQAMEWYEKAAAAGNSNAMSQIGWMYEHGNGVGRDYAQAMEWYEKAADAGNSYGMANIGTMYYYGNGVEVDYDEAYEWFKKAAELGNTTAMEWVEGMKSMGF